MRYPHCTRLGLINVPLVLAILKIENERTESLKARKDLILSMLSNIETDTKNAEYYREITAQLKQGGEMEHGETHHIDHTHAKEKRYQRLEKG